MAVERIRFWFEDIWRNGLPPAICEPTTVLIVILTGTGGGLRSQQRIVVKIKIPFWIRAHVFYCSSLIIIRSDKSYCHYEEHPKIEQKLFPVEKIALEHVQNHLGLCVV